MERAVLRASDEGHLEGGLRSIFIVAPRHVCCVARETGPHFLGCFYLLPGRVVALEQLGPGMVSWLALRTQQQFALANIPW
jgi:hypothetical protein